MPLPELTKMMFNKYKKVKQKLGGRVFAVGDVHGCLTQLQDLLQQINFDQNVDQVVFLGDLIDRGPDSFATLEFVLDKPYFHLVAGNHEHLFYEYVKGAKALSSDMLQFWRNAEGKWVEQLSAETQELYADKLDRQACFIIEVETHSGTVFGLTHAGYEHRTWFDGNGEYQDDHFGKAMWSRRCAEAAPNTLAPVKGIDFTLHGHTIFAQPQLNGNAIFIDTGCQIGGALTGLDLNAFGLSRALDKACVAVRNKTQEVSSL